MKIMRIFALNKKNPPDVNSRNFEKHKNFIELCKYKNSKNFVYCPWVY